MGEEKHRENYHWRCGFVFLLFVYEKVKIVGIML